MVSKEKKKKEVFVYGWEDFSGAYVSPDKKGEHGCIKLSKRLGLEELQSKKYRLVEVEE